MNWFRFIPFIFAIVAGCLVVAQTLSRCACRKYRLGWHHLLIEEDKYGFDHTHTRDMCSR